MADFVFTKVLFRTKADDIEGALAEFRKIPPGITEKALAKKISNGEIVVKKVN